jgi:hypothetical protein
MSAFPDGPASGFFYPVRLSGGTDLPALKSGSEISAAMRASLDHAPSGSGVCWGIPFDVGRVFLLHGDPVDVLFDEPVEAGWLVVMHTSDLGEPDADMHGFISPMKGSGMLGETAGAYSFRYEDGTAETVTIRRRHEIGAFTRRWGENCFQSVPHRKPHPLRAHHEQPASSWGRSQTRVEAADSLPWQNWLFAWRNPHPQRKITGMRLEPGVGSVVLSAVSAGDATDHPLRWLSRRKALLDLSAGTEGERGFDPDLDSDGRLACIDLDMGQVISATRRPVYPHDDWD